MDRMKAVELLRECLAAIPHLRRLHHDNQEYELWVCKVRDIIKAVLDADDVGRFLAGRKYWAVGPRTPDSDLQKYYLEDVNRAETTLKSIIQKYEILGFEAGPAAAKPSCDAAEVPHYLFDRMQFHPRVIAASKSLFETGHYAQAIFEAFKAVNNFVKERADIFSLDGKKLMGEVFNEKGPIIKLNQGRMQSDRDEQEGFKFLFMGAMVGIRNPKAHDDVVQTDPYRTLEYLGFASLLMKRIEEGEITPR